MLKYKIIFFIPVMTYRSTLQALGLHWQPVAQDGNDMAYTVTQDSINNQV